MTRFLLLLAGLAVSSATAAEEPREFCPDRPGLGTPACTMEAGRVAAELGIADWTLEKSGGSRTDTFAFADLLVRYGLTDSLEMQVGWTGAGATRERSPGGSVDRRSGTGDVRVALRQNLANPDGSGFSAALMPYATLPTGGRVLGAGDWSAGLLLPLSYELPHDLQIALTAKAEAAVDEDRRGRHLAYGAVIGMDVPVSKQLTATAELSAERDEDPAGHSTPLIGGLSLAFLAGPSFQLDAGVNAGLGGGAPDVEVYLGIARRF